MQSDLLSKRKPISHLLKKLPSSSYNYQFSLDFDMYRSTQLGDLSQLFKYCYIENLMRPIVSSSSLHALLHNHYLFSSSNADFLLYYKSQENPVHSLEDEVQRCEIESLPKFGMHAVVYTWDGEQWNIDETCEASNKAPACHVMVYNNKMYIVYTELMTYLDQYDSESGQRKSYEITEDYLEYAEEFLIRDIGRRYDYMHYGIKSPEKDKGHEYAGRSKSDTTKSFHDELTEATRDTNFCIVYTNSSECFSRMSSYTNIDHIDYLDLILPESLIFEYNLQDLDNSFIPEEETTLSSLVLSQYIRRDKYFNEGNPLETSILATEQVLPKHASSEDEVRFDSMPSENESESLDSIHSEENCTLPQYPKVLFTRSSSAKGYWSLYYDNDVDMIELISRNTHSKSESFGTESWETESVAIMVSFSDFDSFDGGKKNSSYISDN